MKKMEETWKLSEAKNDFVSAMLFSSAGKSSGILRCRGRTGSARAFLENLPSCGYDGLGCLPSACTLWYDVICWADMEKRPPVWRYFRLHLNFGAALHSLSGVCSKKRHLGVSHFCAKPMIYFHSSSLQRISW